MQWRLFTLLACTLAAVGCEKAESVPPVETVRDFYTLRIHARANGAPTAAELSQMAPYLSRELQALLTKASAEYAPTATPTAEAERTIENGDWFTSTFDGPTSFIVGKVEPIPTGHVVSVKFTSAKQLPAVNWRDRITVVQEDGRYVIANVEFDSHWAFRDGATLVDALKDPEQRRKRRAS